MEVAAVGAPMMVIGIIYIVIFGRWLLPDRSNGIADLMKAPREYHQIFQYMKYEIFKNVRIL